MTACYLINITPSTALNGNTPYEKWYGKCANYSMLRTFGYAVFSHQGEVKLEPRARKCVFLGYPKEVKGYRLWDRSQKGGKVIVSRDVTFNESEMPCLGLDLEKLGEDQQEGDSRQLETIKVSTHIPSTSSEVEVQQPERDDIGETVVRNI
ncbi:Retrovirus-related Pol polyprotein from transposon TNT 1-94 [Abeliophyllum distichum]|uniref:Retrovirus-related Pol polyprotein from transposon TNT 1-94 n=1 Tax=Abeliophyllum distichum TaxID=126358 RepID=A0ABD1U1G9_9LAMI